MIEETEQLNLQITDPFSASKNHPKLSKFPKPDLSQLVPYTPDKTQVTDAFAKFVLLLPPPSSYIGLKQTLPFLLIFDFFPL